MSPLFQAKDKIPPIGSKEWMRWFQNEEAGVPFDKGTQSTDYSLQLAGALSNFYDWKCNQGGVFVEGGNACHQAKKLKLQMRLMQAPQNKVYPIERSPAVQELLR